MSSLTLSKHESGFEHFNGLTHLVHLVPVSNFLEHTVDFVQSGNKLE